MGVLNFSTDNLITGVNIIEGNLYWTDDRNEPKKLEIDRFRENSVTGGVTYNSNGDILSHTDVTVIRPHPFKVIDLDLTEYTPTDTQPEPPFEKIFPRFSYRWRYEDGQYSTYAPFTQPAFLSRTRDTDTDNENYTEGFNTTLFNNVGSIRLDNIPRGTRDVVAVDLLYTESISSTIYVLETLEIPEAQRGIDFIVDSSVYEFGEPNNTSYALQPLSYELNARKVYRALPANQLTRNFDNVPRLAKAQEITANRLIYGNYLQGYDQSSSINMNTALIQAESFPYFYPDIFPQYAGTTPDTAARDALNELSISDGIHVKGNRTYEIGVAYIDPFGRQGAMIPQGSITSADGSIITESSFRTPFNQATRQALVCTINDEAPTWADSYRYFIKDVSMDHHNLIAYNIYNDGAANENMSEYVWAEFLSTDRNKIQDETILVPRRVNTSIEPTKNRHLVQDIENEAPNAVRNQIAQGPDVEYISQGLPATSSLFSYRANADYNGTSLPPTGNPTGRFVYVAEESDEGIGRHGWYAAINGFLAQNRLETLQENVIDLRTGKIPQTQSVSIPFDADQQLYIQFTGQDTYHQIKGFSFSPVNPQDEDAGESRDVLTIEFYEDIPSGVTQSVGFAFFTARITEEAQERLQGRFWVRIARNNLSSGRSMFMDDGSIGTLHQVWFETEPIVDDSNLDLFWEASQTFCVCTEHGWPNKINWYNSIAEASTGIGVYLESQRINNQFNSVQLVKGVRVNVPQDRFNEERRAYGLIWSGIYNSRTGINRLNEFIQADGIVKELEPNYGSLQKLHTRDTNLIAMCEDKVFSILADKDLLFNADGGGNVSAANAVLGQTTPYVGEYGISTNPESFASYGNHIWFADKKRGVMIQFVPVTSPQTQLFEISSRGMEDFFRDRLFSSNRIIGMYDDYGDKYIVSLQGYDPNDVIIDPNDQIEGEDGNISLGYEVRTEGWVSRYSFIPEAGLTLNNKFYTWKNGLLYMHNSGNVGRNNFYGTQYGSEIEIVFNDNPSAVKEFLTLGYEGTDNWIIKGIDPENSEEINYDVANDNFPFVRKEGKFFKPLVTMEPIYQFNSSGVLEESVNFREKSGIKGFYNVVRMEIDPALNSNQIDPRTISQELFAINTENYISSN